MESVRVLHIEDDRAQSLIVRELLDLITERHFEVDWVPSYEQGLDALKRNEHEICLLDYRLGRRDGVGLLKEAVAAGTLVPVILLTGLMDPQLDMRAIAAGAEDYLRKDQITSGLLERSMRYAMERRRFRQVIADQQAILIDSARFSALGEMAGGVAHEINNPLTIIQGRAELLFAMAEEGQLDLEAVKAATSKITTTAQRISKIVSGLRAFSRDTSNDATQETRLRDVVQECLELCRERFRNHGTEIRVEIIPDTLSVEGRSTQLAQAVLNLLSNSFYAVNSLQERWVELRASERGEFVELLLTDSGPGIPVAIRDKIFQPFFSTRELGRGMGLGLCISRGIIESHHGRIEIRSDCPNTRFAILLPRRQPERQRQAA